MKNDLTGPKETAPADLFQSPSQLRLEDDRQGNENDRHPLLQHPVDDVQVEDFTDDSDHPQDQQAFDQGHSPCIADKDE